MKPPWTPGPWRWVDPSRPETESTWNTSLRNDAGEEVFSKYLGSGEWDETWFPEEANARLIALAPETIDLLERVVDELEGAAVEVYGSEPHPLVVEARDLLARARATR